jgi:hypothetical protein
MQTVKIRIKARIDEHWSSWFADLEIRYTQEGDTVLAGPVADQAALYGVLNRLRDLGLPLQSVMCVEPDDVEAQ